MTEVASLYVRVQADVAGATRSLKGMEGQFAAAGASAKRMDAQIAASAATNTRAAGANRALAASSAKVSASQVAATAATAKATTATNGLNKSAQSAKAGLSGFGVGSMAAQGGALALAYGLGKSVKSAVDFDRGMRNVNSIAQLSEGQFQKLSESVRGMAGRTAQSPQTLAAGLYDLVSSGFDARDSMKVLEASANAATAGLTTTEVSTAAVAAVLNAYHLPAKKAGAVSDTLFKTVDRGVISFEQLANNIGDVLPFASTLGVNLNQVGASISTMTKGGINPAETMTRIKAVMASLIQPSESLKATMRGMGYESATSMLRARGFQGSLDMLARSTGGSKEKLAQLFPNIRALGGVMALTGNNAKSAKGDVESFKNTLGATQTALSEQKKSTQFKFDKAKADMEDLAIGIGNTLIPKLGEAAEDATKIGRNLKTGLDGAGGSIDKIFGKGSGKKLGGDLTTSLFGIPKMIKGWGSQISGMASQAWNGKRPAKVPISVVPKVENSDLDKVGDQIKSAGKKGKISLTVDSNAKKVTPQLEEVGKAASDINKKKPKVSVTFPGLNTGRSNLAQLRTDIESLPSSKTINVTVRTHKEGKASGGRTGGGLVEVNERGPEAVRYPDGTVSMLGNGKRMVTALPPGSWVYTASEVRGMQHLASGGLVKPKRKKGESKDEYNARLAKWRQRINRHNQRIDKRSQIKDYNDDRAKAKIPLIFDSSGNLVTDTIAEDNSNLARARRHLAEAKKMRGPDRNARIAAANAEVAQAEQQLALDQANVSATQNNTAALQAQTDALKSLGDEMKKSRDFAERVHTARGGITDTAFQRMLDGTLGGDLTDWLLTNSLRWQT